MTPLIGRIYQPAGLNGVTGYFMVMSKTKTHVILSPLFYRVEIVFMKLERDWFSLGYERFEWKAFDHFNPVMKGRFDHQCLRRWRWIARNQTE